METLLGGTFVVCTILIVVLGAAMLSVALIMVGNRIRDAILHYTIRNALTQEHADDTVES